MPSKLKSHSRLARNNCEYRQDILLDIKVSSLTIIQETALLRRRTNLLKRIQHFTTARVKFMPGLTEYSSSLSLPDTLTATPECIPLYLPSALPEDQWQKICVCGIDQIEERLCFTQASEALVQLRLQLMKRTVTVRYRSRSDESQQHHTRFRTLQDQTNNKIKSEQMKYTIARKAILSLHGPGASGWECSLKVLLPGDIRGLGEHGLRVEEQDMDRQAQELAGLDSTVRWSLTEICDMISAPLPPTQFIPSLARGEGCRTLSWIWYSTTGEELNNHETEACRH